MTAGRERDYAAEYRSRVQRSKDRGFETYREQRRTISLGSVEARRRALDAVGLMRREGLSLTAAARKASTTPATVRRHAGAALDQTSRRVRVKPLDRMRLRMAVLTPGGMVDVETRTSGQRTLISEHSNAVRRFVNTGDATALAKFRGRQVAGVDFETDLAAIEAWGRIGEIDLDDIYSLPTK